MLASCFDYSSALKIEASFPVEDWAIIIRLNGGISQGTEFFISTPIEISYSVVYMQRKNNGEWKANMICTDKVRSEIRAEDTFGIVIMCIIVHGQEIRY
jgi:hypothetical protein